MVVEEEEPVQLVKTTSKRRIDMHKIISAIIAFVKEVFAGKHQKAANGRIDSKYAKVSATHGHKRCSVARNRRHNNRKSKHDSKLRYNVLGKGSVIFVDGANLLGSFGPAEAAHVLSSVADGLEAMGYFCRIFLEHRSWKYYRCSQESESARASFESACKTLGVTIVGREADFVILQALMSVAKSVAITNDRYSDYAKAFPELVGTLRLRGFSVSEVEGEKLIAIDGLTKAIKVRRIHHVRSYTNNVSAGLCGHGNALLKKGNLRGAAHCFKKMISRHNVDGCAGLVEIYMHQGDDKNADKVAMLGEKLFCRMREKVRRSYRLAAESRRSGHKQVYTECA